MERITSIPLPLVELLSQDREFSKSGVSGSAHPSNLDSPAREGFEWGSDELAGCAYVMFSHFVQRIWPLALMELADRVPIKNSRSDAL